MQVGPRAPFLGVGAQPPGTRSHLHGVTLLLAGHASGRGLHSSAVAATYKYVNLREPSMDMKSVTDRAAQTLLWTELIRGGPGGQEA